MQKDVMIDLETFGTSPSAAIASIGAVAFDSTAEPGTEIGAPFIAGVSLSSAMKAGGTVDAKTIEWWFRQPGAQRAWLELAHDPLSVALERLRVWWGQRVAERIWANGITFDVVILNAAYRAQGSRAPWSFRAARDMRTLGWVADVEDSDWDEAKRVAQGLLVGMGRPGFVAHDPLADAVEQAVVVQTAMKRLRG